MTALAVTLFRWLSSALNALATLLLLAMIVFIAAWCSATDAPEDWLSSLVLPFAPGAHLLGVP